MLDREPIVTEIWKRMSQVTGVASTGRNPGVPPQATDMPAINIFELTDVPISIDKRGGKPMMVREFELAIEVILSGTDDRAVSRELVVFLTEVYIALFAEPRINGIKQITEIRRTRIVTVDAGNNVKGIGVLFRITYSEDISSYA